MTPPLAGIVERLRGTYAGGYPLLLLFDYDGTLSPIVNHPAQAALPPATRDLLEHLSRLPFVRIGVLSGRSLANVKECVGLPGLDYAGTGGLEWEIDGECCVHPGAIEAMPLLHQAAEELRPIAETFPGAWIERKPLAFTVHYRAVAALDTPACTRHVEQILLPHARKLRVTHATAAFEVSPQLDWSKGSVIRLIHEALPPDAGVLYAGDSAGDVEAMRVTAELGGVTLGVGAEAPSISSHFLPDPPTLTSLLQDLLRELENQDPCR